MLRKPHYAWLVCLGGALALMITMGLGANVFTVYQPEIIARNGFTNAQGSWITTTRTLFILGTLLCVNSLCKRLGLRLAMTLGMLLIALSCFTFGLAKTFPMYCLAAAITGVGYCLGGMVPLSLIISNWFTARRSLALGIASAGSGITTIFVPPVVTILIQNYGLKTAFFCEGTFVLLVTAVTWYLLRTRPADLGLESYGAETQPLVSRPKGQEKKLPVAPILLAAFLLGGPLGPAFSHLAVLFSSKGFDPMVVAGLISYLGIALCVGKVISGQLYDRLGGLRTNYCIFLMYLAGHLLCAAANNIPLAFLALTTFAFGVTVSAVSPAVWAADLASAEDYPKLVRTITVSYTAGMLLFGPLPGILADRTGSYAPAYLLFAVFLLVSTALVQSVYHRYGLGGKPS